MGLTTLCLIHCLLTPFVILFLPAASAFFTDELENILVLVIVPIALAGFFPTWLRHKNPKLVLTFLAGMSLMALSQVFLHPQAHYGEDGVTLAGVFEISGVFAGAVLMSWATFKNSRHTHVCHNPQHDHSHDPV